SPRTGAKRECGSGRVCSESPSERTRTDGWSGGSSTRGKGGGGTSPYELSHRTWRDGQVTVLATTVGSGRPCFCPNIDHHRANIGNPRAWAPWRCVRETRVNPPGGKPAAASRCHTAGPQSTSSRAVPARTKKLQFVSPGAGTAAPTPR